MGRRRRTLLNAPTGRTHTAPPARTRDGMPAAAESVATYGTPGPTVDAMEDPVPLDELLTPDPTEEDIPTEVAPRPFVKDPAAGNPVEAPAPELDAKPDAADDLARPAPAEVDGMVPALVMVGVVGLLVIAIAGVYLLTR